MRWKHLEQWIGRRRCFEPLGRIHQQRSQLGRLDQHGWEEFVFRGQQFGGVLWRRHVDRRFLRQLFVCLHPA
jgi:hypothetical protein